MAHQSTTGAPPSNRLRLDAHGRALPRTDEEREAQRRAALAMLDRWEREPVTDPPGETEAFMRSLDAERPHRPLFEGLP